MNEGVSLTRSISNTPNPHKKIPVLPLHFFSKPLIVIAANGNEHSIGEVRKQIAKSMGIIDPDRSVVLKLFPLKSMTPKLQCPAVLCDSAHHIVRHTIRDSR